MCLSYQLVYVDGGKPLFVFILDLKYNQDINDNYFRNCPVDTLRRFNVYQTSIRHCQRRIDVL